MIFQEMILIHRIFGCIGGRKKDREKKTKKLINMINDVKEKLSIYPIFSYFFLHIA